MNKFICAALVLAVASLAVAYNFEDSDFNQFLARDYEDFFSDPEPLHHRTRREENTQKDCKKRHIKVCCGEKSFEEQYEKDKEMKKECFKQVTGKEREPHYFFRDPFKCENIEQRKKEMTCVAECVVKKKGFSDNDGKLKIAELTAHLKEYFSKEPWMAAVADNIIQKCIDEANVATPTAAVPSTDRLDACNPSGLKLARCLFREIQLSCPADQIKDEKTCSRIKERIKKNEDIFSQVQIAVDDITDN